MSVNGAAGDAGAAGGNGSGMGRGRRPTSIDVARAAGVSQSTVSRALSGEGPVSPDVRDRVMQAARALNYTPNAIARSLITQSTRIVGIVMAGMTSPFQTYVLEKFLQRLGGRGRQALVFSAPAGQDVDEVLPTVLEYQLDGLIITSAALSTRRIDDCVRAGIPVVLFNRNVAGGRLSAVCCDNVAGGRTVAAELTDAGHHHLAYIAGNQDSSTNRDREQGFGDELRRRGMADWSREQAYYSYESGFEAATRLLAARPGVDGIFCASDIIALGAIDAARRLGRRVPDDLSIIGFDDVPMAQWPPYDLTTIRQPVDAMIELTLRLLLQGDGAADGARTRLLAGALVRRGSARTAVGGEVTGTPPAQGG